VLQVLGRNLESVVNAATDLKKKWGDQFCSVEHLVQALAADARFGEALFKAEGLTKQKLEEAIKDVSWQVDLQGWPGQGGGSWRMV
jgi:ATP-dependent Clp protease ATP-binding subunit ClpB